MRVRSQAERILACTCIWPLHRQGMGDSQWTSSNRQAPFGLTKFFFRSSVQHRSQEVVHLTHWCRVAQPDSSPSLSEATLLSNAGGSRWSEGGLRAPELVRRPYLHGDFWSSLPRSHPTETSANQLFQKYPELLTTSPRLRKCGNALKKSWLLPNPHISLRANSVFSTVLEAVLQHSSSSLALPFG